METQVAYTTPMKPNVSHTRKEAGIPSNEISEYDVALGTFAIARYSYSYWYNVANNPGHLWNHVKSKNKKTRW